MAGVAGVAVAWVMVAVAVVAVVGEPEEDITVAGSAFLLEALAPD